MHVLPEGAQETCSDTFSDRGRSAWVLCKLYQRTVVVFAPCVGLSVFVLRAAMKEMCGFAAFVRAEGP